MAKTIAMVVLPGVSGMAEDRYVNTFHFDGPGSYEADVASIQVRLQFFYNQNPGPGLPLSDFLAHRISRASCEIRTYDYAQGKPRLPTVLPFTLGASTSGTGDMPEEVAAVLTYHGQPPITPRKRGRIYLGPLNNWASSGHATVGVKPVVHPDFMLAARLAAQALAYGPDMGAVLVEPKWCVLSEGARVPRPNKDAPLGALLSPIWTPVVAGWIDNAWDTQRRRGNDPTVRDRWDAVLPPEGS